MKHYVTVRAIKKEPIDLDRFVAALLALALARVEAQESEQQPSDEAEEERGD